MNSLEAYLRHPEYQHVKNSIIEEPQIVNQEFGFQMICKRELGFYEIFSNTLFERELSEKNGFANPIWLRYETEANMWFQIFVEFENQLFYLLAMPVWNNKHAYSLQFHRVHPPEYIPLEKPHLLEDCKKIIQTQIVRDLRANPKTKLKIIYNPPIFD